MTKNSILVAFVAVFGGLLALPAQAQVNLKSISIGASYWKPSLDYWNTKSNLVDFNNGAGATLSGKIMPTAALEIGLVKGLSLGGRVGIWQSSASSPLSIAGISRTEKLTVSIIPVSLDLKYTFEPAAVAANTEESPKSAFLTPYIGVSVARYFVTNKFDRQVTGAAGSVNETQTGNNYGVQVFVGAEKKLVKMLYAALDVRYHLGNYNQVVKTETTSTIEKVSLNGVEAGLSLRLKFN
ncbi:hypothetical protein [Spirosoma luteum]|uniref:hypothetical protein n=1 Tax=Spirosoma luteum TaxID=431553 RepID=UPI0003779AE6|nr:hypothetical protein [Spirosoma luteum]